MVALRNDGTPLSEGTTRATKLHRTHHERQPQCKAAPGPYPGSYVHPGAHPVLQFVKNMQSLTLDLVKHPWGADWKKANDALRQETLQIKQDTNAARISADSSQHQNRTRSYADTIRQGCRPASAHSLSAHGSDSSAGITRSELGEDREVIVHLGDADAVKGYRSISTKDMETRAGRVKVDAALRLGVPTPRRWPLWLGRLPVEVGWYLCFPTRSAKETEIARTITDRPKTSEKKGQGPSADMGDHCARRQRMVANTSHPGL
ncbi:hypothetical protein N7523_005742 [Penicillium sp. IBT 18751x]|nr:hypothetical protein N7523_005665 [Penicillium sp. IBT 18751x]KAJ6117991.1 hypothetical protein N7523_005742 [Penicillium sp. IBT 18751x]